MPATAERNERELQARHAQIQAGIAADETELDVRIALLEERESVQRALEAAKIARDAATDAAYRAKTAARREQYLREVNVELVALWRLVPELRWVLAGLSVLEERHAEIGDGRTWSDVSGLPFGSTRHLGAAISQSLAGSRLGQEAYSAGEVSPPIIEPVEDPSSTRVAMIPRGLPHRYV